MSLSGPARGLEPDWISLERPENSCASDTPRPTWQSLRGSANL
jgi:hypothetical protein